MNTLVEIYSVDAEPNDPADASTGNDSVGFLVVTCEIPLTRMGNYLLNSLWGSGSGTFKYTSPPHAMVRFCDDSADIGWCSHQHATQLKPG